MFFKPQISLKVGNVFERHACFDKYELVCIIKINQFIHLLIQCILMFSARVASDPRVAAPQTRASAFLFIIFFAMKQCPITAKIAGLIGILPHYVLNNFFTKKYYGLPDL